MKISQRILVTGGTGTVGFALVRKLIAAGYAVRVLSRDEHKQSVLEQELPHVEWMLGDVRDAERVCEVMQDVHTVVHCAAYKHVRLCERNPGEARKTNVEGTRNVLAAARSCSVRSLVFVSSDKAVQPCSVMGKTKHEAEQLVLRAAAADEAAIAVMRTGNVLGSRGSVIPVVQQQLLAGKSVTVTDPGMTRFCIGINALSALLLRVLEQPINGAIYVPKMPVAATGDIINVVVEHTVATYRLPPQQVQVRIIGKRPGERSHERIMTRDEASRVVEQDNAYAILPHVGGSMGTAIVCDSADHQPLTAQQLKPLIVEALRQCSNDTLQTTSVA